MVGVFVTPYYGWKRLYWIGCFSFPLIPIVYVTLPVSVKYLALRGRTEEIKTILARYGPNTRADTVRNPQADSSGVFTFMKAAVPLTPSGM